jgi:hypothetical protein
LLSLLVVLGAIVAPARGAEDAAWLSACSPSFRPGNEATNLLQLIPQVLAQDPRLEVLIVDDNSPDGTRGWRTKSPAQVLVHAIHREGKLGLGTAYITGFKGR